MAGKFDILFSYVLLTCFYNGNVIEGAGLLIGQ